MFSRRVAFVRLSGISPGTLQERLNDWKQNCTTYVDKRSCHRKQAVTLMMRSWIAWALENIADKPPHLPGVRVFSCSSRKLLFATMVEMNNSSNFMGRRPKLSTFYKVLLSYKDPSCNADGMCDPKIKKIRFFKQSKFTKCHLCCALKSTKRFVPAGAKDLMARLDAAHTKHNLWQMSEVPILIFPYISIY